MFVLLLLQSMFWAIAGISAMPFAVAGEIFMLGLGIASLLLALATCLLAVGVLWRRRRARRWVMVLEVVCVVGSLLLLALPIGANHGPVSLMTNLALPIAVVLLLRNGKSVADIEHAALAGLAVEESAGEPQLASYHQATPTN